MILTNQLRDKLKSIVSDELERLPEYLEKMEPKDRINCILKLLPYVFPKVESVSFDQGEPFQWPGQLS